MLHIWVALQVTTSKTDSMECTLYVATFDVIEIFASSFGARRMSTSSVLNGNFVLLFHISFAACMGKSLQQMSLRNCVMLGASRLGFSESINVKNMNRHPKCARGFAIVMVHRVDEHFWRWFFNAVSRLRLSQASIAPPYLDVCLQLDEQLWSQIPATRDPIWWVTEVRFKDPESNNASRNPSAC